MEINNKIPLYPLPKDIQYSDELLTIPKKKVISLRMKSKDKRAISLVRYWALRHDLKLGKKADENISFVLIQKTGKDIMYKDTAGIYSDEIYKITFSYKKAIFTAEIYYSGLPGLRNALASMAQILRAKSISTCTFTDYPDFKIRGIIEGYYGTPWSQEARLKMLDFLADCKFNAYFYGPKDDAYHREQWRELYDTDSIANLKKIIDESSKRALDFWYTLGPGLSMKYSSKSDIDDLLKKFLQLTDIGVRHFGLFFDDIPDELQHTEDKTAFTDLPEAHISISNKIYTKLTSLYSDLKFAICPTQYHGKGTEYYIARLGDGLDPRIEIFWTGPEICSRNLTLDDTFLLSRQIHRPVLFWDNYPVNDLEMAHELHIGPYRERDRHLFRASTGVVANGMEYPESSKIAFHTIGAYLWSAESYDPEYSWDIALKDVVGHRDWENFRIFADNSRYSCLYPDDSPNLSTRLQEYEFENKYGDSNKGLLLLKELLSELNRAVELFNSGMENTILQKEIAPWIDKFVQGTKLLTFIYKIQQNPDSSLLQELRALFTTYQNNKIKIFADVLYPIVKTYIDSGIKKTEQRK